MSTPGSPSASVPGSLPTVPALALLIDHAVPRPTQTERDVVDACTIARRERIASICVKPFYVPDCARPVRLLRQTVGDRVGVKASGGIRTLDDALAMIDAGASRLGTSATAPILDELREWRGER